MKKVDEKVLLNVKSPFLFQEYGDKGRQEYFLMYTYSFFFKKMAMRKVAGEYVLIVLTLFFQEYGNEKGESMFQGIHTLSFSRKWESIFNECTLFHFQEYDNE